jgi:hypothetical protein
MQTIDRRYKRVLSRGISAFKEALNQDRLSNPDVFPWAATIAHELFESYLMLEAGSYLQLNTRSTLEMFDDFFFALRDRESTILQYAEYVNHSTFSTELVRDFPEFSARLETRMRGEEIGNPNLGLRLPEIVRQRFARIMLLQLSMIEQPSIRVYTATIRYLPRENWDRLMEAKSTPEATARAGDMTEITPEGLYHGFFSLIGTIHAINDLDGITTREESADMAQLLEYARNAIDWRLNFRSHESSRRFELLRNNVLDDATEELSGYQRTRLRQRLNDVLDEVIGLVPA